MIITLEESQKGLSDLRERVLPVGWWVADERVLLAGRVPAISAVVNLSPEVALAEVASLSDEAILSEEGYVELSMVYTHH